MTASRFLFYQFQYGLYMGVFNAAKVAPGVGDRTADQAAAELKLPAKFNSYMTGSVAGVPDAIIGTVKQRSDGNVKAIYAELK